MAFVITCRIAVPWKKGAAPTVVPGMRVVIEISLFKVREAIYRAKSSQGTLSPLGPVNVILTRESPGDGFASVLMITASLSE